MNDEIKQNLLKTGTSIVGLVCRDGIVLAADKQTSYGDHLIGHKDTLKIQKINDYLVLAEAGVVSDVQLMKGGFLIIQKGVGEMPGSVLGTSLFLDAGFYQNIGIVLSPESNVEAGDVLFVGVIYDVNHDRRYDNTDFVNSPKDQNGWPLRAAFSVRESN